MKSDSRILDKIITSRKFGYPIIRDRDQEFPIHPNMSDAGRGGTTRMLPGRRRCGDAWLRGGGAGCGGAGQRGCGWAARMRPSRTARMRNGGVYAAAPAPALWRLLAWVGVGGMEPRQAGIGRGRGRCAVGRSARRRSEVCASAGKGKTHSGGWRLGRPVWLWCESGIGQMETGVG